MMKMISSILWKLNSPELKTKEDLSAFTYNQCLYTAVERCKVKKHEMSVHGEIKLKIKILISVMIVHLNQVYFGIIKLTQEIIIGVVNSLAMSVVIQQVGKVI